jgi:transketolase C-terminal domain/subunit
MDMDGVKLDIQKREAYKVQIFKQAKECKKIVCLFCDVNSSEKNIYIWKNITKILC